MGTHLREAIGLDLDTPPTQGNLCDGDDNVRFYRQTVQAHRAELGKLEGWLWGAGIGLTVGIGLLQPYATVIVAVACMVVAGVVHRRRTKAHAKKIESILRQMPPEKAEAERKRTETLRWYS